MEKLVWSERPPNAVGYWWQKSQETAPHVTFYREGDLKWVGPSDPSNSTMEWAGPVPAPMNPNDCICTGMAEAGDSGPGVWQCPVHGHTGTMGGLLQLGKTYLAELAALHAELEVISKHSGPEPQGISKENLIDLFLKLAELRMERGR